MNWVLRVVLVGLIASLSLTGCKESSSEGGFAESPGTNPSQPNDPSFVIGPEEEQPTPEAPVVDEAGSDEFLFYADENACLNEAGLPGLNIGLGSCGDASGVNLQGDSLQGADLAGVDLSRSTLTDVDLSQADLTGADLSESRLERVDLTETELNDVDMKDAVIVESVIANLDVLDQLVEAGAELAEDNSFPAELDEIEWVAGDNFDIRSKEPTPIDRQPSSKKGSDKGKEVVDIETEEGGLDQVDDLRDDVIAWKAQWEENRKKLVDGKKGVRHLRKKRKEERKHIESLRAGLKDNRQDLKELVAQKKQFSQKLRALRSALAKEENKRKKKEMRKEFAALKKQRAQVVAAIKRSRGEKKELRGDLLQLRDSVRALIAQAKENRSQLKEIRQANRDLKKKIKHALNKLRKIRKSLAQN